MDLDFVGGQKVREGDGDPPRGGINAELPICWVEFLVVFARFVVHNQIALVRKAVVSLRRGQFEALNVLGELVKDHAQALVRCTRIAVAVGEGKVSFAFRQTRNRLPIPGTGFLL